MKIQCDVCSAREASVFCCADEAALCAACDRRVHRANKLAGKHLRFSLLLPSAPKSHPLCDICQEKRGFLFCQEDRAILCRDCDVSIHTANDLTMKHRRFLLAGVRLSSAPMPSPPESAADIPNNQQKGPAAAAAEDEIVCNSSTTTAAANNSNSISEYLIKMLPGWHVEDLLLEDAAAAAGSYQVNELVPPFVERWVDASVEDSHTSTGVPHLSPSNSPDCWHQEINNNISKDEVRERVRGESFSGSKASWQRRGEEDVLMVPQFHSSKRLKPTLW